MYEKNTQTKGKGMIVTISGLIGSGKTTVAKLLADDLKFRLVQAGAIFRELAREREMSLIEFSKLAEFDDKIDELIDQRQRELAKGGNVIVDSRLGGWLIDADIKIWLKASLKERARRVAMREDKDFETALEETKIREISEFKRYKDLYGIDLDDLSIYDLVINTELWSPEVIAQTIKNLIKKKR